MQARQTMTLTEVDEVLGGVHKNRVAHEGIFDGCIGDINVEYLGEGVNTQDIEIALLDFYAYKEIAFETWEHFHNKFCNNWNEKFFVLRQNLQNAKEFSVSDETETFKGGTKLLSNTKASGVSNTVQHGDIKDKQKFTNTPNEYDGNLYGLTSMQDNASVSDSTGKVDNTSNADTNANTERDYQRMKTGNAFSRWIALSLENRNMIYDFIRSFKHLFLNTIVIKNYLRRY